MLTTKILTSHSCTDFNTPLTFCRTVFLFSSPLEIELDEVVPAGGAAMTGLFLENTERRLLPPQTFKGAPEQWALQELLTTLTVS